MTLMPLNTGNKILHIDWDDRKFNKYYGLVNIGQNTEMDYLNSPINDTILHKMSDEYTKPLDRFRMIFIGDSLDMQVASIMCDSVRNQFKEIIPNHDDNRVSYGGVWEYYWFCHSKRSNYDIIGHRAYYGVHPYPPFNNVRYRWFNELPNVSNDLEKRFQYFFMRSFYGLNRYGPKDIIVFSAHYWIIWRIRWYGRKDPEDDSKFVLEKDVAKRFEHSLETNMTTMVECIKREFPLHKGFIMHTVPLPMFKDTRFPNTNVHFFNKVIKRVARKTRVALFDWEKLLRPFERKDVLKDTQHPNYDVSSILSSTLVKVVLNIFKDN